LWEQSLSAIQIEIGEGHSDLYNLFLGKEEAMRLTTRKQRGKANILESHDLAKLLFKAIVDADLFDKSLKVVLKHRRYGSDYARGWWSIETVRSNIFFRTKNRKRKVLVTISNSLFNRKGIPIVSEELQELVNSVCRKYYRKKFPKG